MEPRYLLDTNICVYIRQKRSPDLLHRFEKLRPGEAVISVITFGELLFGAEKSSHRTAARVRSCPRSTSSGPLIPSHPTHKRNSVHAISQWRDLEFGRKLR